MADGPGYPQVLTMTIAIGSIKHDIVLLRGMSLKIAKLHAADQLAQFIKGDVLTEALKAIGFK